MNNFASYFEFEAYLRCEFPRKYSEGIWLLDSFHFKFVSSNKYQTIYAKATKIQCCKKKSKSPTVKITRYQIFVCKVPKTSVLSTIQFTIYFGSYLLRWINSYLPDKTPNTIDTIERKISSTHPVQYALVKIKI